jgi:hypothetical protein
MQTPMRDGTDLAPKNESTPNVGTEGFWTRERGKGQSLRRSCSHALLLGHNPLVLVARCIWHTDLGGDATLPSPQRLHLTTDVTSRA